MELARACSEIAWACLIAIWIAANAGGFLTDLNLAATTTAGICGAVIGLHGVWRIVFHKHRGRRHDDQAPH